MEMRGSHLGIEQFLAQVAAGVGSATRHCSLRLFPFPPPVSERSGCHWDLPPRPLSPAELAVWFVQDGWAVTSALLLLVPTCLAAACGVIWVSPVSERPLDVCCVLFHGKVCLWLVG